jgi:hypothetical protein
LLKKPANSVRIYKTYFSPKTWTRN